MFGRKKFTRNVMGHTLPAPKPTRWAFYYILRYIGLPICLILTGLDMMLFFIFKYVFNSCYGFFCLF